MNEGRSNKLRILEAALAIEDQIASIISHWFFGTTHARKSAFDSLVLSSDWCSFAAKRKLLMHIIEDGSFFQGKEKDSFAKLLQKVMSCRNAFAHGQLSSDGTRVWISFFEGTPREQELTDEYLTSIEETLLNCYHALLDLSLKTGSTKQATDLPESDLKSVVPEIPNLVAKSSTGKGELRITGKG